MDSSTMTSVSLLLATSANSPSSPVRHEDSSSLIALTPTSFHTFGYSDEINSTVYNQSIWSSAASTAITAMFADVNVTAKSEHYPHEQIHRHLSWTNLVLALALCVLIVITVIGNTLVILSVLTTRRLRTVTNCFVSSLAIADLMVGIFVMPPAVALYLIGMYKYQQVLVFK